MHKGCPSCWAARVARCRTKAAQVPQRLPVRRASSNCGAAHALFHRTRCSSRRCSTFSSSPATRPVAGSTRASQFIHRQPASRSRINACFCWAPWPARHADMHDLRPCPNRTHTGAGGLQQSHRLVRQLRRRGNAHQPPPRRPHRHALHTVARSYTGTSPRGSNRLLDARLIDTHRLKNAAPTPDLSKWRLYSDQVVAQWCVTHLGPAPV